MNRQDYVNKMYDILRDSTKFEELKHEDPFTLTIKLEDKINRTVRSLKDKNIISNEEATFLMVSGSSLGVLYGLPKVHKDNVPTRPIMSACNTPSYNVSKFLVPKLLHLAENECTIKNSYQFSEKICNLRYTNPYLMCSFDVTSLFTNVPVNETIDIIIEKLFPGDDSKYYNMSKKEFRQLLSLAVKDSVFIFDKKIFKQVEGLAMGSPLAPVMANIFLCHFEKLWLQECPDAYKPKEYIRYVDDTFLLFEDIQQAQQFLNYINSRHVNIKLTIEEAVDGKSPYLDTFCKEGSK